MVYKRRYAKLKGFDVTLLDIATRKERKKGEIPKNMVVVQSLLNGNTAIVKKSMLKNIKYKTTFFDK